MRFHPTTLNLNEAATTAIKAFRDAKPWRGTPEEKLAKFTDLHRGLARAYDLETMLLRGDSDEFGASGASYFALRLNKIVLKGRLSVVTYLFCFATACGLQRMAATAWARETFRHFFPRSWARCSDRDGLFVNSGF